MLCWYVVCDFGNSLDCLGGVLSVFAHNIKIKIELEEGTFQNILTKYKHTLTPKCLEIEIKDIQSEERKDIIFDINLPVVPKEHLNRVIGKVTVVYKHAVTGKVEEFSSAVIVNRGKETSKQTNDEVQRQQCRMKAAINIEKAAELGHQGKFEDAKLLIDTTIKEIKSSPCGADMFVKE
jgi:hypothetical protein